jgi:hypothetical protein
MAERRLILASRSPQRRAILEQLGVEFEVRPADVEELEDGVPGLVALENARRKAEAVAAADDLVLGVDTVVALGFATAYVIQGRGAAHPCPASAVIHTSDLRAPRRQARGRPAGLGPT